MLKFWGSQILYMDFQLWGARHLYPGLFKGQLYVYFIINSLPFYLFSVSTLGCLNRH